MSDILTKQILKQLKELPITKKKAILELIKENDTALKQEKSLEQWRQKLLKTSVWTDSQIDEIYKARNYINKWMPNQSF
jgi:hypothetical protein